LPVTRATISATRCQCSRRPAGMGRPVGSRHPRAGLGAVVADKGLGVGLRQPLGLPAKLERSTL